MYTKNGSRSVGRILVLTEKLQGGGICASVYVREQGDDRWTHVLDSRYALIVDATDGAPDAFTYPESAEAMEGE